MKHNLRQPEGGRVKMTPLPASLRGSLKRTHLPGLDGLRAVAAFSVVFYHAGVPFISGGVGVLVFFVLSGFLITWLLLKENDQTGGVSLRDFYTRRALRIFPAFYCYSGLVLALALVRHRAVLWPQAVASLLYVNDYYQALNGDPNTAFSHTWSLAIEEQFYLLWPALFLMLRSDYQRLARFLAVAIGVLWLYRAVLVLVVKVHQGYIYEAFDTRADHLLIGCLLAVILRTGLFSRFWEWISARPWTAFGSAGMLAASSVAEVRYGADYRDTISFIANPLLAALLIGQMIAFSGTSVWNWMNWPWVRYLGRISYSIYLYQQVLIDIPKKFLGGRPMLVQLAATMILVTIAASFSYFVIEKPFLRLKARFSPVAPPVAA
ncbi:MAG: acyltransferase [Acidobacteriota bacterium]